MRAHRSIYFTGMRLSGYRGEPAWHHPTDAERPREERAAGHAFTAQHAAVRCGCCGGARFYDSAIDIRGMHALVCAHCTQVAMFNAQPVRN